MKRFMRALGNALLTVLVMILIVYGWIFVEIKLLVRPQPEIFGFAFFMQPLDDMMPDINMNDVVVVAKNADYQAGDILLYFDSKDSKYKIRYAYSMNEDTITTKTAVDTTSNDVIPRNNVVGKAVRKVAFFGAIVNFFKQKAVLITIGVVGITFLVISQYLEYKPKKKTSDENKSLQKDN